jgi:CxxC motif-containing protein (DUF1111 family)
MVSKKKVAGMAAAGIKQRRLGRFSYHSRKNRVRLKTDAFFNDGGVSSGQHDERSVTPCRRQTHCRRSPMGEIIVVTARADAGEMNMFGKQAGLA